MQYYEVIFPKQKSPIMNIFTYHSESKLNIGDGIIAKLRNKDFQGVVLREVKKPTFKTNPITEVFAEKLLSENQIKLFYYICEYYFSNPSRTINLFTPKKIEKLNTDKFPLTPTAQNSSEIQSIATNPPEFKLNTTQQEILDFLHQKEDKIHLIHGITGSGKTIIYLKRAEEIINQGKQVLILIPEISLTPQTIKIFKDYFNPDIISLHHSKLNPTEQLKEWIKIKNNQSKIIIGSRSSLFLPFQNLGLIIMDEEHDQAYKQEQNPRYHSRTILQWYQSNLKIQAIIGSATPSIETYVAALDAKKIIKHEILHRSQYQPIPHIKLIDLKDELKKGNKSQISEYLQAKIHSKLEKKEQVLILHNKRGFANQLTCTDCGFTLNCPRCSISLTLHKNFGTSHLNCHYCDYKCDTPAECPQCQSVSLKSIGTGIQKIYQELEELYPKAKIQRVDSDTTSGKNAHQEVYDSLKKAEFDIVIGTQMIATGLDISTISLVGVTNADIAINMPDFRASERAFQLLTQVSGRTGRGTDLGEVVIQTFNPEHPVLQAVQSNNLKNFFDTEIHFRKEFNYPPFNKLTKLTFSNTKVEKVSQEVKRVEKLLSDLGVGFKSAPALIDKKNNKFYHHILISSLNPGKFLSSLGLGPDWWVDRDPVNTI